MKLYALMAEARTRCNRRAFRPGVATDGSKTVIVWTDLESDYRVSVIKDGERLVEGERYNRVLNMTHPTSR